MWSEVEEVRYVAEERCGEAYLGTQGVASVEAQGRVSYTF